MSEYDTEPEEKRDVIIAHDPDPERVGATETVPLSTAVRMVREGKARYADAEPFEVPAWYRRLHNMPAASGPAAEGEPQDGPATDSGAESSDAGDQGDSGDHDEGHDEGQDPAGDEADRDDEAGADKPASRRRAGGRRGTHTGE